MQSNQDAIRDAMRLAQSPAGQQLLQLLRTAGGQELDQAMNKALSGDYQDAKKLLANLMTDPRTAELMNQIGGNHGSNGR